MSSRAFRSICAFALLAVVAGQVELPSTVKTCRRGTEDYSSCLRLAIQESWPTFVKGIPELDLPPLDPFFVEMEEGSYENGELHGKVVVKNSRTYGLAKARFLAVRPHYKDNVFRLEIDYELPKVFIEGDYKADGRLGPLTIGGKGYYNISIENVRTTWDMEGTVQDDRWVVKHFRMLPEVGKMQIYFSDLFDGNESLNKAALTFANEYWPFLYRRMLPIVSTFWDARLTEFVNRIFSKISFAKTFP